ncbi:hypothetical protein LIER_43517 [Lithospermum erythrorhizon]|uniref:GAG-pre-integrase domain-containing protein n=1 Tax=Lithospermum erythrorhizon TaxID=34254 RepID=A0AAV3QA83_LITER
MYDPTRGAIATVSMSSNRLFPLKIESIESSFLAKTKDPSWLWHYRYGHLSMDGLKALQQKSMFTGLPQLGTLSQVCEECIVGKQSRSQFPKANSWRAKTVLELVHFDICGPINPASNGGKRYFITFINDFSRKTSIYFLLEKSEAFSTFISFKARVENEIGNTIKTLRTDRGGEPKNLDCFVMIVESEESLQQLILPNKMNPNQVVYDFDDESEFSPVPHSLDNTTVPIVETSTTPMVTNEESPNICRIPMDTSEESLNVSHIRRRPTWTKKPPPKAYMNKKGLIYSCSLNFVEPYSMPPGLCNQVRLPPKLM